MERSNRFTITAAFASSDFGRNGAELPAGSGEGGEAYTGIESPCFPKAEF